LKDKKTVFVLGAGASCPYGYPSGARLRERICLSPGFWQSYNISYEIVNPLVQKESRLEEIQKFQNAFSKSKIKSVDLFMANNPTLAPIGKYIIAFEIFQAERQSYFGEEAKLKQEEMADEQRRGIRGPLNLLSSPLFMGQDWYSYLYNRILEVLVGKEALPHFSNNNLTFITFNYDRSLEQFFYEALRYSFTEVTEERVVQCLKQLKISHVYGQIASLKWQNQDDYVDYSFQVDETVLQKAANNIRTIYEEKENPELIEAQNLLQQADEIFFVGFGYAQENMEVLGLPGVISPNCLVYGTAFNMIDEEARRIKATIDHGRKTQGRYHKGPTNIESVDCLMLLRKYLN